MVTLDNMDFPDHVILDLAEPLRQYDEETKEQTTYFYTFEELIDHALAYIDVDEENNGIVELVGDIYQTQVDLGVKHPEVTASAVWRFAEVLLSELDIHSLFDERGHCPYVVSDFLGDAFTVVLTRLNADGTRYD